MKRILSFLLVTLLLFSLAPTCFAASTEAAEAAEELYALGLFQGKGTNANGTPIFALDDAPTRQEAVTMLVRLLGKESEAKAGTWDIPFTDVADWAKPYVGYAYANGITSGTSSTTFGGSSTVTATQYLTFVLRSLGYDSSTDFKWNAAWELSDHIGLTNGTYSAATTKFTRGDVAIISCAALSAPLKDRDTTLVASLLANDTVEIGVVVFLGLMPGSKTVPVDVKINDKGECWVSYETLKAVFPEMKYYSYNGSINVIPTNIDDYFMQSGQLMHLIASSGSQGEDRGNGCFIPGYDPRFFSLYSAPTTMCAFFIGDPEQISDDTYRLSFTTCDYDVSHLYAQQKQAFAALEELPFIPLDEVASVNADRFIVGWQMETEYNAFWKRHQQYFLWSQLTSESPIWTMIAMDQFDESLSWDGGYGAQWRMYLLLDSDNTPIGYTINYFK